MGFRCGYLSLIILLNIPGVLAEKMKMNCSPVTICALRESTVNLKCYPNTIKPQQSFWFSYKQKDKWRNEADPEDLALDLDYAGRVSYTETKYIYSASLTITDLREGDSGEYHLMLITDKGKKYLSSEAITLTVSDLQITSTPQQTEQTLNCSTSCSLSTRFSDYIWKKNGQTIIKTIEYQKILRLNDDTHPGSYSCSVSSHEKIYSNTVCVSEEICWSVNYSDRRVCVLEGSSVDFSCTYSYPSDHTVTEVFWYNFKPKVDPTDLSKEPPFAGRVDFLGDKERSCNLRMKNLTKSDSGLYHFRFVTDREGGKFFGNPGVILNITDLQVKVSPSSPLEGQTVTLTCISTCSLPNNPTYIWYKNGQPVTNKPTRYNKLYLESASSEEVKEYSCALAEAHGGSARKIMLTFIILGVLMAVILIARWMWIRRRKSRLDKDNEGIEENEQCTVYSNVSALAMTSDPTPKESPGDQDDLHYSSIQFKYSHAQKEATPPISINESQDVQYAAVKFNRDGAAT